MTKPPIMGSIRWTEMLVGGLLWWSSGWAPNAGGPGSIPGQGTRSHMLQLRPQLRAGTAE